MKALILFGSPRANGNCASLVKTFVDNFDGEVDFAYAFAGHGKSGISGCINCMSCKENDCVLHDDFDKLIKDDYQILVIASPIYYSNLPGPMMNVISRFNYLYNSKKKASARTKKQGLLILTGGGTPFAPFMGSSNEENSIKQAKYIFRSVNATLNDDDMVLSLNTDVVSAKADTMAQDKIRRLAKRLSQKA